ncbi:unnamed protein product [Nyctereutes procyonoides]|uniref:(raccoon dog) hypothetical protein n=1 Tax=Nyctereutes procyonoides TaxID=34880 RepID=A0A811Y9I0_NYCPR|nr:unnamed protein product [Nyctereutes procyonoides]
MQIYSNQTTVNTSTSRNPANASTRATRGALQSTASLSMISFSLLHLYC